MIFKASMDALAKGFTIAITLLFAAVIAGNIALYQTGEHLVSVISIGLIGGIYLTVFLLRITAFEITRESLIIHRPLKNKIILREGIARAGRVQKDGLKWSIRTFGNGGLFGYYGKFSNTKMGAMTWYATRRDNAILMQTKEGQNIILTPDDPEGFLHALNNF